MSGGRLFHACIGAATARVGGVRTPPTFWIGTLDPPNFWDFNMGPPMGPPHGTLMGPPQNFWTPPWDPVDWTRPKFVTEKIENRVGKIDQLPPPPRIYEPHRLPPPVEIGPENSINYPPSNLRTSSTTPPPPRNRAGKLHQLPPPSNLRTSSTTPPPRNRFGPPQLLKRGGAPACLWSSMCESPVAERCCCGSRDDEIADWS